jgi:hypothetical protein
LKGVNFNNYDYEKIKKDFYDNKNILEFPNQLNISKKNHEMFLNYMTKTIFLNSYDKRIFTKDKKNTKPVIQTIEY